MEIRVLPYSSNELRLVDHRSDFYSLGCILHHLLTGEPLFSEYVKGEVMTPEIALEIAVAHRSESPIPPTAGREPLLDQLVLQLLAKAPTLRYRTGILHSCPGSNDLEKGLIYDLRAIGNGASTDATFKIGEADRAARFAFPRSRTYRNFLLI